MYRPHAAIAHCNLVRTERARLERCKPWALAEKRDVRSGFALKHLPHEDQFSAFVAIADTVADHSFAQHCRQLRRKIAHLIRMWEKHQLRLRRFDRLLQ